jgi:methylenetetrahydrofolate reductase (NADPH)
LLRKSGLEPIVHIAARRMRAAADLQNLLAGLRGEADVRRLLVIGGDVDASGPYPDALAVIQKGRLREAGIEEIGIGAYPEGHSRIPAGRLEAALDEKIASAAAQGLRVHIVSQFSFSPEHILAWLKQLRACGITRPVKVGMAGPTSMPALLRYAKRCGVNASLRGLMSGAAAGLIGQVMGNVGPDRIVETLSLAGDLGDAAPHYFSFGGAVETARYACSTSRRLAAGHAMAQPNLN